jgi:hypothetical protein
MLLLPARPMDAIAEAKRKSKCLGYLKKKNGGAQGASDRFGKKAKPRSHLALLLTILHIHIHTPNYKLQFGRLPCKKSCFFSTKNAFDPPPKRHWTGGKPRFVLEQKRHPIPKSTEVKEQPRGIFGSSYRNRKRRAKHGKIGFLHPQSHAWLFQSVLFP